MATAKKATKRTAKRPRKAVTKRASNQRLRLTDERKAEVLAMANEGGPEAVAKAYGYSLGYATQLATKCGYRKPGAANRGAYTKERADATRITKAVARYLDQCREHGANGKPGVWLGSLKGYPARTSDPETVAAVIDLYQREVIPALTSPVQELKARQRVMTLRRELERMRKVSNGTADAAREDFVLVAADWAVTNGISYAAFREMGVPADVLREAGITA